MRLTHINHSILKHLRYKEIKAMEKIEMKILKHEKNKGSYFIKHKALAELNDVDIKGQKDDILYSASIEVGYHPFMYGLYGGKISKSAKENEYIIVWETGISCD